MYLALLCLLGTLSINNQIFQIEHKLLRIPTGGRLTSWLFTQRGRGVKLPRTNPDDSGRMKDLNQEPPDFKSSALNHPVTPPHQYYHVLLYGYKSTRTLIGC